ncbi:hypothetical protein [Parageobacillus galactosidasius]|nr:hypothetical protein [Parageobacillus galactosidasius]
MSKDWEEKCKDHHKPKIRCGCINGQVVTVNGVSQDFVGTFLIPENRCKS